MHDATSQFSFSGLRLAIAPGVPTSHLSALLALQRAEEPEVTISFHEVTGDDLVMGLREGRYDAGMSLEGLSDPVLKSQPLWTENMAVALPLRFPLLNQAKLTIAELLAYPVYRWPAESCPLLDQRLSSLPATNQQSIQHVSSFEMIALWVAAGDGVGVSAQSRIEHAHGWNLQARALSDGPYQIVTYLLTLTGQVNPVGERFEHRALQFTRGA